MRGLLDRNPGNIEVLSEEQISASLLVLTKLETQPEGSGATSSYRIMTLRQVGNPIANIPSGKRVANIPGK